MARGRRPDTARSNGNIQFAGWLEQHDDLAVIARKQIFFVGGAPRSGTTWVQQILDSHPEISCGGEGLFQKHLADPLDTAIDARRRVLAEKNTAVFGHTGGFPLPATEDTNVVLGTAILLALRQQAGDKPCRAIGEKTPENVFFFPRLKQIFPGAKCIAISRDPRDVLTSAWHFFHKPQPGEDEVEAKLAFIRLAIPSLDLGARTILDLATRLPADVMTITYEALRRSPELTVSNMFRFLRVSDASRVVADCAARTSFSALTGGRTAGNAQNGTFFRNGVAGAWRSTLTAEMNDLVLRDLGWMFPRFGWKP